MNTNQTLKAAAAKHDTETLIGALLILETAATLTKEERMVKAATSDVITERHHLNDAMDEVFMDDDFVGTYTDAILICLERVAA